MVEQWNWLSINGAIEPGLVNPARLKLGIKSAQGRNEALEQLILIQVEVFMVRLEIVTTIYDMVASKMLR